MSEKTLTKSIRLPQVAVSTIALVLLANPIVNSQEAKTVSTKIQFTELQVPTTASLRGLCIVNQKIMWASGSEGTVIHTQDAGKTWQVKRMPGAEKMEFRDVHAFANGTAMILGAGTPALIYRKQNLQSEWTNVYRNDHSKIFFDAFDFWDDKRGIAFSDPIDGRLILIQTNDGGKTWRSPDSNLPQTLSDEAGFAASGTCLTTFGKQHVWIGLGGKPANKETRFARVLYSDDSGASWSEANTTIKRSQSAGVFSLFFIDEDNGFAVGGDYLKPDETVSNFSLTRDGGKTWRSARNSTLTGFRSCVAASKVPELGWVLLATGTNGTDISLDLGETWLKASKEGFHAIGFVPGTGQGWATGADGKVARFTLK